MVIKICPRCNQRYAWNPNMGPDYVHDCGRIGAGSAVKFDSIQKIGNWTDFTGSGSAPNVNLQGRGSKASGRRVGIDNIDTMQLGKRKATHRLRRHLEYIEVG